MIGLGGVLPARFVGKGIQLLGVLVDGRLGDR